MKDDSPGERQDAVESCSAEMLFDIDHTLVVNSHSAVGAAKEDVDGAARRYSQSERRLSNYMREEGR